MSNKIGILRKIWGKNKTDHDNSSESQLKEKNLFQITFDNHENPERSFSFDVNNPQHIYYVGSNQAKNNVLEEELETEVIMEPQQRHRKSQKNKDTSSDESVLEVKQNSIVLSQPRVLTWHNKNAFVYKVETKYSIDGERPDLEFVIYIPIDTAVNWLNSTRQKTPGYISESSPAERNPDKAVIMAPEQEIKYGIEETDDGNRKPQIMTWNNKKSDSLDSEEDRDNNRKQTIMTWKNKKKSDSVDSDSDEDKKKPDRIKEKKVKVPNKKQKKARRVITTYEEDEDEISLGRLRPQESTRQPVKIIAAEDNKFY